MARNETERGMELSKSRHNTTTPAKRPPTTHAWDSSACHRNPSFPHILWMSLQNYIRTHPTPSTVTQFVKLPIRRCRSININMRGRVKINMEQFMKSVFCSNRQRSKKQPRIRVTRNGNGWMDSHSTIEVVAWRWSSEWCYRVLTCTPATILWHVYGLFGYYSILAKTNSSSFDFYTITFPFYGHRDERQATSDNILITPLTPQPRFPKIGEQQQHPFNCFH